MSAYNVIDLRCPGCGGPASANVKLCDYCGREVVISTFSSVYAMPVQDVNKYVNSYRKILSENSDDPTINFSIGICYLKLKLYDKALMSFEKAIEENFENSETYFYAAVSLLKGKKAFLTPIADIKKAEVYLNAALEIENKAIYYYFLAYLKYDFYERKHLNTSPTFTDALTIANENNITHNDIQYLFELLNVARPDSI